MNYADRHAKCMLPVVRIRSGKATGSGTVIHATKDNSVYVLTNQHVIDDLVEVKKEWSALLRREVKKDKLGVPTVEFFEYRWESRSVGARSIEADIVAYDKNEDLALLKLRSDTPVPAVATLFPRGKEDTLRITMPVYAVGAGMGAPPVITEGMLSQFGQEIDNLEFWLNTANSIFGNSGGALFLAETGEQIGVPARITVNLSGFSADAITHLSYAIPVTRIWNFLDDQKFRFIESDEYTEESEAAERKRLREREERRMEGESEDDD